MWKAIHEGDVLTVQAALAKGTKVDAKIRAWRLLRWAIQAGKLEILRLLVKNGANLRQPAQEGCTPLDQAVGLGNLEVVKYLIEQRADVNQPSANCTPLHTAAAWGRFEIAQFLLDKGANKRIKDAQGRNPRYFAAYYGHQNLKELLKVRSPNNTT